MRAANKQFKTGREFGFSGLLPFCIWLPLELDVEAALRKAAVRQLGSAEVIGAGFLMGSLGLTGMDDVTGREGCGLGEKN